MNRTLLFVLTLLSLGATVVVGADLPFQSVEEWVTLSFRYPSGRFRLASEGTDIQAFDHAWDDTTGRGLPPDRYFSHLDEDGDSVGVYVWVDPPPGKYFFVERSGVDSSFAIPRFYRMGLDLVPPLALTGESVPPGTITEPMLGDSAIASTRLLLSGIVRNGAIDGLDGAKIVSGTLPAAALANGAVTPEKLATGERFFSATAGDEVEAQTGYFVRIQPFTGGPLELVGPTEITQGHDMQSGSDLTFLSGSSLLANSGATVDFGTTVALGATAQPTTIRGPLATQGDMTFGAAASHEADFRGSVTLGSLGDSTMVHPVHGFLQYENTVTATATALNQTGIVAFPGATSDMLFDVYCPGATSFGLGAFIGQYESPGHVRWYSSTSSGSARTIYIVGKKR